MNGPVILNNAREQLADEIFGYRDPKPSPLKISPWLAMSLLQKAIRRGESQFAQRAAATLCIIAPDRLWRRCGAAAFEEIGVADLQTVSLVTAALAGKRYRATIGGEWKVASFIVDRMTKAPKCRAADDLLLTADSHPRYRGARSDLATKTTTRTNSHSFRRRCAACTCACNLVCGWDSPRQTKHLSARRGEPAALFDGLCEAGLPHTAVEIAREGFRKIGEPLCPFVALLCPLVINEASVIESDELPPQIMVGEVPGWALDVYTREGRAANT